MVILLKKTSRQSSIISFSPKSSWGRRPKTRHSPPLGKHPRCTQNNKKRTLVHHHMIRRLEKDKANVYPCLRLALPSECIHSNPASLLVFCYCPCVCDRVATATTTIVFFFRYVSRDRFLFFSLRRGRRWFNKGGWPKYTQIITNCVVFLCSFFDY